jgi:serine protease AprX
MDLAPNSNIKRRWLAAGVVVFGAGLLTPIAPAFAAVTSPPQAVVIRGDASWCTSTVAADVSALGGRMTRSIGILGGGSALLPAGAVTALSHAPCVAAVTPDGRLTLDSIGGYDPTSDVGSLYNTEQIIGAQTAWSRGYTGQGVGVALIDTGVAPVQGLNGSGQVVNGADLSFDSQSPVLTNNDAFGHGTHMAGIIAGNDTYGAGTKYAGNANQFTGVAPDAHILNMKVADENGIVDVSQVIASLDWVYQHRADNGLNIRVVNLSFGTDSTQSYQLDPLAFAAEVLWRNGLVVVVSAGNKGNSSNGLNDPAMDPYVLAVGAVDTQGSLNTANHTVATFSSSGNGTRNPDLVAPGVHIASLRDPGSYLDNMYGSTATVSSNTRFFRGSGTSQATAVVSGAAALYLSSNPKATPDQVKYALTSTATSLNQPSALQGAGELNVKSALTASLPTNKYTQTFTPSTGTGSLEAARGSLHVVNAGITLTGEKDIFGNAFNTASTATAEASGTAWSGGTFNGTAWSGTAWSSTGWSSTAWSGTAWSGTAWSGTAWSGTAWSSTGWSSTGWSSTGWSSTGWSGASWASTGWSSTGWSTTGWSTTGWSDYDWS